MSSASMDVQSGADERSLPNEPSRALRSAIRLERVTIVSQVVITVLVAVVAGQSQAMKAAWIDDMLALLPPVAFLIAARRIRRPPDVDHPYGYHRSIGVAHLVAGSALFAMGAYLAIDSAMALVKVERPPIGIMVIGGWQIWAGWVMVLVIGVTNVTPAVLGHYKMKLAEPLHDKVLYADAKMSRADWTSALATIVGVLGVGLGWWWADSAAAIVVSTSILRDGVSNIRSAVSGLTDRRARSYDDRQPHPLIERIDAELASTGWIDHAVSRVRDEGHLFHVEAFVVPAEGRPVTADRCADLVDRLRALDWKVHDVVIAPLPELPAGQAFPPERPSTTTGGV
ncbi:cation diffusion facilitator family transporter [Acidipropionibacterium acidipropionici]|uniref:cation diffusion facilitator family transporter n=1 Tax=Acidipropionibacterium acidipropionici TaxID=1748 RepID=UPI00110BD8F4|nr:cation diffusion facilitator family transporter [Acidipropionibacterium acidipropionici]QCV94080.1 cation transporter [Acidipropionibacterium acidipropionici]